MKNFKKFISLFLSIALALSVFGNFNVMQAEAATATFFIPDNQKLRDTANLDLGFVGGTSTAPPDALTRDKVYISNDGYLDDKGTFQDVSGTSLSVRVDQIAYSGTEWKIQDGKTRNSSVPSPSPNRYQISKLQLFPGYNKITLTGQQGGVDKSDIFYVLYESGPVLVSLQLYEGNTLVDVNQSSRIVTRQGAVVFQGTVLNATSVTVNGNRGSVTENGSFFSPGVILTPGINKIEFIFKNASDELKFTREIYFYDQQQPFSSIKVTQGGSTHDIVNNSATFTGETLVGELEIEVLVPYQAIPFGGNSELKINGGSTIALPAGSSPYFVEEEVFYGTSNQPEFRRVHFKIPSSDYSLKPESVGGTIPATTQSLSLVLTYGANAQKSTASINRTYNVAPNQVLLKNAYLLPGITDDNANKVTVNTPKQPLNGSNVDKSDFYILVESSATPPIDPLEIKFEPLGTLTLAPVKGSTFDGPAGNPNKFTVYKVEKFPEGSQNLVFQYRAKNSTLKVKVNFVAKTYIQVDNLTDGQVIELNSTPGSGITNIVKLKGQFIGFGTNILDPKLFINNTDQTGLLDFKLNADGLTHRFPDGYPKDSIDLVVGENTTPPSPLHYGENIIKFVIKYGTTDNVVREYIKEIKIYIVDKNTPKISLVRPITVPKGVRAGLNGDPSTYLLPSPEFQPSGTLANTYTTTHKSFDYFLEGSGASEISIKKAGELIFKFRPSTNEKETTITPGVTPTDVIEVLHNTLPPGTSLDYFGLKSGFKIRINGLPINELGAHVYTAELKSDTGSPVTSRLEINRTTAPYRVLAPKANVGKQIVVNKNFVLFDIEAEGAKEVIVNGIVAEKRSDIDDRFTATVTKLKADKDNKIKLTIKRESGDINDTVNVYYASDVGVDSMYMEKLSTKHSVFNKKLQLNFPKNTVLRRNSDNKIYPDSTILFGIASPDDGVVGRVNDYGDVLGINPDQTNQLRDDNGNPIITYIVSQLYERFRSPVGRDHFTTVSPYYWISVGYAERGNPGDSNYQTATGGLPPYNHINTFSTTMPNLTFSPEIRKLTPSQRGTIEIGFDPNIVVDAGSYLTVFHFNDQGEWTNIGGVVDMKSKTVTVPFSEFGYYTVAKLKYSFRDIVDHSWARNVLSALYAKGLMTNLRFEDFGADDYTTRGEFAAILVKAMDLPLNYDNVNSFLDVVPGSRTSTWSYEEIETAARAGIIHGMSDRVFNPGGRITREEAATMITRTLNLKTSEINDKLIAKLSKTFVDGPSISRYALPGVDAVYSAKIMAGQPADPKNKKLFVFNPQANLTRAEAGQIMVNILKKYNQKFAKELS